MTPKGRIETKAGAQAVRVLPLLLLLAGPAPGLQVEGFTSDAVQEAVNAASAGDTLFFPPGEYAFTGTVVIDRSLTLRGAAELLDVGVVEPGEPNDPPYWSGPASVCLTEDPDLRLFRVESDDVTFERLKLAGVVTHETGTCEGISVHGHDRLVVRNCEITRFLRGIDLRNSRRSVVTGSYLHENYRNGYGYGVAISGPTMESGGSEVSIYRNEFTLNRHGIASNSPQTRFTVEDNYFHDNDLVQGQACVDIHPQGGYTIRAVVRDNIFERTTPMGFKSGSIEITGNYIDPGCGDYEVGGYSRMLDFGPPTHNGNFIPQAILHDIYIADNVNDTDPWRRLLWIYDWEYEGETRFVAYNVFVDGRLFKHNSAMDNAPWHPTPARAPDPSSDRSTSPSPTPTSGSAASRPAPGTTCTPWPWTPRAGGTSPRSACRSPAPGACPGIGRTASSSRISPPQRATSSAVPGTPSTPGRPRGRPTGAMSPAQRDPTSTAPRASGRAAASTAFV